MSPFATARLGRPFLYVSPTIEIASPSAELTRPITGTHNHVRLAKPLSTRSAAADLAGARRDIGPKAGYSMTDNGTMLLDKVEIPHVNFLARFAKVDPDSGAYEKPPNAKLSYGPPLLVTFQSSRY